MARFRKKPVMIEAAQWNGDHFVGGCPEDWPVIALEIHPSNAPCLPDGQIAVSGQQLFIATKEGVMIAGVGDWIIRGVAGEIYPCKPEIFAATYEPEQEAPTFNQGE